jgi:hypothetical protein
VTTKKEKKIAATKNIKHRDESFQNANRDASDEKDSEKWEHWGPLSVTSNNKR